MSKKKIALLGSTGRMGTTILRLLQDSSDYQSQIECVWHGSGRVLFPQDFEAVSKAEVLVDVSHPQTLLNFLKLWRRFQKKKIFPKVLICSTGFEAHQKSKIQKILGSRAFFVPNTSSGLRAISEVLRSLRATLGKSYHVEIFEAHHAAKKDAPSGTALLLAECLKTQKNEKILIHSFRGGTNPGEHRVIFAGPKERIEVTHFAEDRELFARGALDWALRW